MNISNLLDNEQDYSVRLNTSYSKTLNANTLEEIELLQSIAKLLYKTKSVRVAINILDRINQGEDFCEIASLPIRQVVFGFDETKPIGYVLRDRRSDSILHNHLNLGDF